VTPWDQRFLQLAAHVATWSKDPSTQVGAVLVGKDKRQVALGYNGFPPGVADSHFRLHHREAKLRYTIHAERNVLDNAAFPTAASTLYVTHPPCCNCTLSIISKGISRVVSSPMSADFASRWAGEIFQSRALLDEANVSCNF
jgi:dCMP deaminase